MRRRHGSSKSIADVCGTPQIKQCASSLLRWLKEQDFSSYDTHDYWASRIGIAAKRIFSSNPLLGILIVAPLYVLDACFPASRILFAHKHASAEALPVIASGCFRLYEMTGEKQHLSLACKLLSRLEEKAVSTEHGLGWGLDFDWQATEFVPKDTPCVTVTAHSTEAFLTGYRITGKSEYLETALKTAEFVFHDLNRKQAKKGVAVSYTHLDHNYVVNANSFAARILATCAEVSGEREKKELAAQLVEYVLSQQQPDGSWYYTDNEQLPNSKNFIDSFHTCFVLSDLAKIWKITGAEDLRKRIVAGYEFFKKAFIRDDYAVRYYHYYPHRSGILVDIRGCAEAIHCSALLGDIDTNSIPLACEIAKWTINNMKHNGGCFFFRQYRTHTNRFPYIRWGQAPMFNALTMLITRLS